MYPNIIYPLGYPKCDGCGYPTGAPIPLGAHKYCGDCYAKGNIKATARPLNSSEIEGLRQILEERFGVEREEMTMKRVLIGVSDQPWPCANCEHEDYWDITGRRDRPMAFCRHCTYGNYASGFRYRPNGPGRKPPVTEPNK